MGSIPPISASQLTEADFQHHPVWQFHTDAQHIQGVDESCVSPAAVVLQPGSFGSYMVAATYHCQNGHVFPGAVQVDILGAKLLFTPVCMYVQGKSVDPLSPDVATRMTRISKATMTRPTQWRLGVYVAGEVALRSGRIARFAWVQALQSLAPHTYDSIDNTP